MKTSGPSSGRHGVFQKRDVIHVDGRPKKGEALKTSFALQLCKLYLTGNLTASKDTPYGCLEGMQEARALKDYRVRDIANRWSETETV